MAASCGFNQSTVLSSSDQCEIADGPTTDDLMVRSHNITDSSLIPPQTEIPRPLLDGFTLNSNSTPADLHWFVRPQRRNFAVSRFLNPVQIRYLGL